MRIPECLNVADWFLDARVREGKGDRSAVRTAEREWTYAEIRSLAHGYGRLLKDAGVKPEQRVIVSLPDGPAFVGALFGAFEIGAVGVMVNPGLDRGAIEYFLDYTRAAAAVVGGPAVGTFAAAKPGARFLERLHVVDDERPAEGLPAGPPLEPFPSHRDDAALWLFSGGTTGKPKAVVQTHRSYVNTTLRYAHGVLGIGPDDVTISVPKLYFGYATGSNLLFPFSVGASTVLFPEPATAGTLFEEIERHRPTILVTVPKMVQHMVEDPGAGERDLSSLRVATSAGEALPVELHRRWDETFGVELLDGLGTAEMWHIFLSNRPGRVKPGTLGEAVPGFEVRVRDERGRDVPDGEIGMLWVRGGSRAIGYWQRMEQTERAFRGEWYVSGDMVWRDAEGSFHYGGRADDMLKVSGKWLSPGEVESCLLEHPAVREVAVVGVPNDAGLTIPRACVVVHGGQVAGEGVDEGFAEELQGFVRDRLEPYKYPREIVFLESLPRTHLGKVDRGRLRDVESA